MDNSAIKERIREVLKENKTNVNNLSNTTKIPQKTLYNQIHSKTKLSVDTIGIILDHFKNLSSDWLLKGKGNKYIYDDASTQMSDAGMSYNTPLHLPFYPCRYLPVYATQLVNNTTFGDHFKELSIAHYFPVVNAGADHFLIQISADLEKWNIITGSLLHAQPVALKKEEIAKNKLYLIKLTDGSYLIREIDSVNEESHLNVCVNEDKKSRVGLNKVESVSLIKAIFKV